MLKTLTDKVTQAARATPVEVKRFVVKGVALLIGWCLLYGLIIKPYDLIDPLLIKCTGMLFYV